MTALDFHAQDARWIAWVNQVRAGKTTKIPKSPRGGNAKVDDPATWGTRAEADACARRVVNGRGGGSGIVLGDLGADVHLGGIDLDSCLQNGAVASWATEILATADSYAEISPSGGGLKVYFYILSADVRPFLDRIGVESNAWGCRRDVPGEDARNHGPAVELYLEKRFFAVTNNHWPGTPDQLRLIDEASLDRLGALIPPTKSQERHKASSGDNSRSAAAFRLARKLRREGKSLEDWVEALKADPVLAEWYRDKGDGRQLQRTWDRAKATNNGAAFSEDELALQLAAAHDGQLRYTPKWSQWFLWSGVHWQEDSILAVFKFARDLCREAAADPSAGNLVRTIKSAKTIAAVTNLVRCDQRIATPQDAWDADPWLFAGEATLELRTGTIREPRPTDLCTKVSAAAPDDRGCPRWLAFLDRVMAGDIELQRYLQRVTGYCLTGSTSEHALFFLFGSGSNGKGVFVNTLRAIWHDYATVAPMEVFVESQGERHPTEIAGLRGARLVVAQETERGRRWAESKIKALTGGDPISARFVRQDFFEFVPQFKLLIAGNHKPGLRGVDEAIRRRMHLIPFSITIPSHERDKDLAEKLKPEWGGILRWALDGCLEWQRIGLAPPPAVLDATDAYLYDEDMHGQWIEERCTLDRIYTARSAALYNDWKPWAEAHGERPGSQKTFTKTLIERGFDRVHDRNGAMFVGIALRP